MSTPLLVLVGVVYVLVAFDLYMQVKYGLSLAFVAYALANAGLILEVMR